MLQFIAGFGLFYMIATVIITIFTGVTILGTGLEEKASKRDITIAILQMVGSIIFVTLITAALGWLIIQPLWLFFKCTCE
jgi:hypothetical protein